MTTTLSSKGQIVLPVVLRRKLALQPGDELDIRLELGGAEPHIVIRRRALERRKMKIVVDSISGLPIVKGPRGTPKLTTEMVAQMMADFP
jgi:AbrB family looped-hinge helix DNA binding protein